MYLGGRLKDARKAAGLNQSQLARLAGITPSAISQIEAGQTKKPSSDNLLPLARALGVDPNWLVTGKGHKKPQPVQANGRIGLIRDASAAPMPGDLSPQEIEVVRCMRDMGDARRDCLHAIARDSAHAARDEQNAAVKTKRA